MKSRITIEVDFDNGNEPVIQILSRNSDDVRDNLIKSFYQRLGGSSWCSIRFEQDVVNHDDYNDGFKRIFIRPISEPQLKEQAEVMLEQHRVYTEFYKNGEKEYVTSVAKQAKRPSNRLDLMSPAEKIITDAVGEIERLGADVRLTEAQILLGKARDLVYDYLENK